MKTRKAARTVLLDSQDCVAIVHVRQNDYYKIPGGGVEDGEDIPTAARREAHEESGCDSEIIAELGSVETIFSDRIDDSTGFLARIKGAKHAPNFDNYEQERGFEITWQPSLCVAIQIIEQHAVADDYARALQKRDLKFLKLAQDYLLKRPQESADFTIKKAAPRCD